VLKAMLALMPARTGPVGFYADGIFALDKKNAHAFSGCLACRSLSHAHSVHLVRASGASRHAWPRLNV
jgi:hypothetical protein